MIRTAVVGVGYLGRFHAQKYASLPNSHLVGVADPSAQARSAVAAELGVAAYADYRELLGHVDAVSIVTPTPLHFEVAKDFLDAGASVLVEKPLTVTVEEGEHLIMLARRANSMRASPSATVTVIGFSTSTLAPASRKSFATSKCKGVGVTMLTAST